MNPKKNSILASQDQILKEAIENPGKILANANKDMTKSISWFTDRVRRQRAKEKGLAGHANSVPTPGHMYLFSYLAKTREKLPYWDMHPLVIPIKYTKTGFYGINFHYLPPQWRARLLRMLIHNFTVSSTEVQYLRMSYEQLSALGAAKAFRPCVKQYLYSQMRARWQRIPPTEWTNAVMLPLQKFVGASASHVWKSSLGKIQ